VIDGSYLLSLAEQAEAAAGPDMALDAEIALVTGWERMPEKLHAWKSPDGIYDRCLISFTESLDAAMTLIPPDAFKKVAVGSGTKRAFAQLIHHPGGPFGGIKRPSIYVTAATPALALCAAALKARASQSHSQTERGEA
jgi:hypothetical protein